MADDIPLTRIANWYSVTRGGDEKIIQHGRTYLQKDHHLRGLSAMLIILGRLAHDDCDCNRKPSTAKHLRSPPFGPHSLTHRLPSLCLTKANLPPGGSPQLSQRV